MDERVIINSFLYKKSSTRFFSYKNRRPLTKQDKITDNGLEVHPTVGQKVQYPVPNEFQAFFEGVKTLATTTFLLKAGIHY